MYFMPLLWDTSDHLNTLTLFLPDILLNYQKYWHICSRATCAHINEGSFAFKCLWNNGDVRLITPVKTLKWMPITWTVKLIFIILPPNEIGGGYTGFTLSVRLSVRPSVCRWHGFRSITQVCFGISISNFICILMVAISRSLLIFSDVTFKMAAWRPYWIFWFPDSNFTSALNINFKLQRHNTYVYG